MVLTFVISVVVLSIAKQHMQEAQLLGVEPALLC
jgi:hypothetical protein